MGKTAWIDDDTGARATCLLDPFDKFALVIALAKIDVEVERLGGPVIEVIR